jgi:hypothetical protein
MPLLFNGMTKPDADAEVAQADDGSAGCRQGRHLPDLSRERQPGRMGSIRRRVQDPTDTMATLMDPRKPASQQPAGRTEAHGGNLQQAHDWMH